MTQKKPRKESAEAVLADARTEMARPESQDPSENKPPQFALRIVLNLLNVTLG
jgi:hypothetical protein